MGFARIFSDAVGSNITANVIASSGYLSLSNPAYSQWASNFLFAAYAPNGLITAVAPAVTTSAGWAMPTGQ
jgi:hypothetical protein